MKTRTSEIFEPMSQVAGAPSDVDRGVTAGGVNFERGRFSIGAVDYYSDDIINIFYTEAKYDIPLSNGHKLKFGAQYSAQDSTGADLLTGSRFLDLAVRLQGRVWRGEARCSRQHGMRTETAPTCALRGAAYRVTTPCRSRISTGPAKTR